MKSYIYEKNEAMTNSKSVIIKKINLKLPAKKIYLCTMTIQEKQQEIIEEFEFLDNWEAEIPKYIIDLGKELKGLPEDKKTDENLIKGCQSKVWLDAEFRDGKLFFNADSDGILPKGIVSLLVRIYSGHSTQEILDSDFDFISKIGLQEFLSPSRANGLMAMTQTN